MLGPTPYWPMPQRRPVHAEPGPQLRSFKPARPMGQQLAADLLGLSPKLQQVAQYCLQHARHLHLCRIQDVAGHCNTQPVTVVRLAKRYGYRGFLDFKMAFLAETQAQAQTDVQTEVQARAVDNNEVALPAPGWQRQSASDSLNTVLGHHARATLEQQRQGLQQVEMEWDGQTFCKAVTLLKRARRVWMHGSPTALPVASCYAELLRAAGLSVQWIRPQSPESASANTGVLTAHDVLLTVSLARDGEADLDAVCMAQRMGVPVVALTDQNHGRLAHTADAHLCVAALGAGLQGLGAAMVLAHALA